MVSRPRKHRISSFTSNNWIITLTLRWFFSVIQVQNNYSFSVELIGNQSKLCRKRLAKILVTNATCAVAMQAILAMQSTGIFWQSFFLKEEFSWYQQYLFNKCGKLEHILKRKSITVVYLVLKLYSCELGWDSIGKIHDSLMAFMTCDFFPLLNLHLGAKVIRDGTEMESGRLSLIATS